MHADLAVAVQLTTVTQVMCWYAGGDLTQDHPALLPHYETSVGFAPNRRSSRCFVLALHLHCLLPNVGSASPHQ